MSTKYLSILKRICLKLDYKKLYWAKSRLLFSLLSAIIAITFGRALKNWINVNYLELNKDFGNKFVEISSSNYQNERVPNAINQTALDISVIL